MKYINRVDALLIEWSRNMEIVRGSALFEKWTLNRFEDLDSKVMHWFGEGG